MAGKKSIQWVVEHHLCVACGTCVSACPRDAIRMVETGVGLLVAAVDESKCNGCGLCVKVCPGSHLEPELLPPGTDPFKGSAVAAYCGRAADRDVLRNGQSGGIVTALLSYLIESGRIDRALVTQMPEDGSLRPRCILTNDIEEIRRAQGSKYCPAALNATLPRNFHESNERTAFVGLPCQVHGLRNWQHHAGVDGGSNVIVLGLACANVLSYLAITHLIQQAGEREADVKAFRYRDKAWRGWPGDVSLRTSQGDARYISARHRHEVWEAFTPAACRLCFDKINILADVVMSDAWHIREDKEGYSTILVRTERGKDLLLGAADAGVISVDPVDQRAVFDALRIERRRMLWTAHTQVWESTGNPAPDFHIEQQWSAHVNGKALKRAAHNLAFSERLLLLDSQEDILRVVRRRVRRQRLLGTLKPRAAMSRAVRGLRRITRRISSQGGHITDTTPLGRE